MDIAKRQVINSLIICTVFTLMALWSIRKNMLEHQALKAYVLCIPFVIFFGCVIVLAMRFRKL